MDVYFRSHKTNSSALCVLDTAAEWRGRRFFLLKSPWKAWNDPLQRNNMLPMRVFQRGAVVLIFTCHYVSLRHSKSSFQWLFILKWRLWKPSFKHFSASAWTLCFVCFIRYRESLRLDFSFPLKLSSVSCCYIICYYHYSQLVVQRLHGGAPGFQLVLVLV